MKKSIQYKWYTIVTTIHYILWFLTVGFCVSLCIVKYIKWLWYL